MIDELFEEFSIEFNIAWFEESWQLFIKHPSNEERKEIFKGVIYHYDEEFRIEEVDIDLYKFLYGIRDESLMTSTMKYRQTTN
jgi:hypothetical protein